MSKDYKRYFFEDFTFGLIKRLTKERAKNEAYLEMIGSVMEQFLRVFNQLLEEGTLDFQFFDSIRAIFDYDNLLHNLHYQIPEEQLKKIRNTTQEWRKDLKIGDMVDAIQDEFPRCAGWSQARISAVAGDTLHLEFIYDTKNTDKYLDRWSVDIALFESKTKEIFEWKQTIENKQQIDSYDKTQWNKSTILEIKDQQIGTDRTVKLAYIAFRVYVEKSNKSDEVGPYEGWSNRFDEWISIYSPRIQPLCTKTLKGLTEDVDIDEDLDYLFEKEEGMKNIYAVPRLRKCTSSLFIHLINVFGNIGGFDNIMKVLERSQSEDIDLNVIGVLLECVSKPFIIYHKSFSQDYSPKIVALAKSKLKSIPEKTLREVKKEKLEAIIKSIDMLSKRITSKEERENEIENIKLSLCLVCLRSSYLDRRIQGLKDFNAIIKNTKYFNNKVITNEYLINWMHENDVFSILFDNKKTHLQIVQRCADVLKLLLLENSLTLELTASFWNLSKSDYKPEVYKIVKEGAFYLKQTHIDYIFEQICNITPDKLSIDEFDLLAELGKYTSSEQFQTQVSNFFWTVIDQSDLYKGDIVTNCISKFCEMMRLWDLEKKQDYLFKLAKNIKDKRSSVPSIKLLKGLLKDEMEKNQYSKVASEVYADMGGVGSYPPRKGDIISVTSDIEKIDEDQKKNEPMDTVIRSLLLDEQLAESLLSNFADYFEKCDQMIESSQIDVKSPRRKQFHVSGNYSHHEEVDERLQFLKYLAQVSDFKISKRELDIIYNLLVVKSKVPSDYEEFLFWCKNSCESSSSTVTILDLNEVGEFFTEKINSKALDLKNLLQVGFEFLQHYFLSVNEKEQKLLKSVKKQKKKQQQFDLAAMYGYGIGPMPLGFSFGTNEKKKEEVQASEPIFKLLKAPNELSKLDIVWNIALDCQNPTVVPKAIKFLINIYTQLDEDLDNIAIQDSLIEKCIQLLDGDNQEDRTNRIIEILKNVIYEAEKKGTGGVQPHNAVLKGELLDKVTIKNKSTNKKGTYVMQVYSNTTVWELRKEIANAFDLAPQYLKLERNDGSSIKDLENGKTLAQLKFQTDEVLSAYRINIEEDVIPEPLTDSEGKLTEKAKQIFNDWFDLYSEDNGQMSRETCALFIKGCTGEQPGPNDDRVNNLFKNYDPNNDGKIEREDFMMFYESASKNKPDTVRDNMRAHNIRPDLKKLSEVEEVSSYSKDDMPRYKISKNQQHFDLLISILDRKDSSSKAAWDLIQMLATNQVVYRRVLELQTAKDNGNGIDWNKFFDTQSVYKLLYTLQIVEAVMEFGTRSERVVSLVLEGSGKNSGQIIQFSAGVKEDHQQDQQEQLIQKSQSIVGDDQLDKELRAGWTTQFLQFNGFQYILSAFLQKEVSQSVNDQSSDQEFSTVFELQHIAFLLKLLRIFIMAAFSNKSNTDGTFQELELLMQGNVGNTILTSINYKVLLDKILKVISQVMQKSKLIFEDKLIVENALSLFEGCLLNQRELVNEFYVFGGEGNIKNSEEFIVHGVLYSELEKIREEFKESLINIATRIPTVEGGIPPLVFILKALAEHFEQTSKYPCIQYFELFCDLVDKFFKQDNAKSGYFNPEILLVLIINKIKEYNRVSSESGDSDSFKMSEDLENIYIGLIHLAGKIIENFEISFCEKVVIENDLIDEIFVKFLFASIFKENTSESKSDLVKIKPRIITKDENSSSGKFGIKSKEAAYHLLHSLIKKSSLLMNSFLTKSMQPLMNLIRRIDGWGYSPPGSSEKLQKFVGIRNLGCICYMNSMLQQFFMVPAFRYNLLCVDDHLPEDLQEYKGFKIDDNVLHQFQKLVAHLELSQRQDYNPYEFCFAFKDLDGNPTNIGEQKDAQEFLNLIFDRLENQLRGTSRKYLMQSVFGGQTCSQMVCMECGKVKNRIEDFYNFSLPVKDIKSMEISLKKMIEGEVINDYYCETCNKKVDISRRTLISQTPNVLIVHLQRIYFNFDTFKNDKINSYWEFPCSLDLRPYSFYDVMRKEGRFNKDEDQEENKTDEDNQLPDEETCYEYKLVGVNVHSGSAHAGHYWSYINTKRGMTEPDSNDPNWSNTENDVWMEYNDSQVKDFNFEKLKDECFGGEKKAESSGGFSFGGFGGFGDTYGKSAYMLVYERKEKRPIKILVDDEEESKMNGGEVFTDEKKQEKYKLIDYRNGVQEIKPNTIYKQVCEDNKKFEFENDVYSQEFFDFIKSIIDAVVELKSSDISKEEVLNCKLSMMKIAKKAVLEIIAKCYYNKCLDSVVDSFVSLLKSDSQLPGIFMEICQQEDDFDYLLSLILESTDSVTRAASAKLIREIIDFLKHQEQSYLEEVKTMEVENEQGEKVMITKYKALSSSFIMKCLSILNNRAAKNWQRIDPFLSVIHCFALGKDENQEEAKDSGVGLDFLMKQKFIERACDFVLGKKSPLCQLQEKRQEMGSSYTNPNFSYLIKLLTRVITDEDLLCKYPMTEVDKKMFLHQDLLKVMLGSSQGSKQFGKCLANMCKDNFKLSKKVGKVFIKSICSANYDTVKNYLTALKPFLRMEDSLKDIKLEWVFGYSQIVSRKGYREERFKYGIEAISNINDETFTYYSPIALGPADETLLGQLLKCKGRQDTFACNCLREMLSLMAKDDKICKFIYKAKAQTYQQSGYLDWIKNYLEMQKIDADKNMQYSYMKVKRESIIKGLTYYQQVLVKVNQYKLEDEAQLKQTLQDGGFKGLEEDWWVGKNEDVLVHYPPQLVIGKQVGDERVFIEDDTNPHVRVVLQEIDNEYNYGNPTGLFNLSIPQVEIKNFNYQSVGYKTYKRLVYQQTNNIKKQQEKAQKELEAQELAKVSGEQVAKAEDPEEKVEEQQQEMKDSDFPVFETQNWEERLKVGSVLMRIMVQSKTKKKVTVKIEIVGGEDTNAQVPISYFQETFMDIETKQLGHLMKIDPSKDWGSLKLKVTVKEYDHSQAPVLGIPSPLDSIKVGCGSCRKLNTVSATSCIQCGQAMVHDLMTVGLDTSGLAGESNQDSYFDQD